MKRRSTRAQGAGASRKSARTSAAAIGLRVASAVLALIGGIAIERAAAATDAEVEAKGTTTFAVPRHVIAGGGGSSSGGVFAIHGAIGQADVDPLQPSSGGVFAVTGGFWPGIEPPAPLGDPVFANGFEPATP
jgi:hypothetical protein